MDKKNLLWTGLVLILAVGAIWIVRNSQDRFSWRETYKIDRKEPYDLYAAYKLMESYAPAGSFHTLKDSLAGLLPEGVNSQAANYFFVGEGLYMREQDRDALLAFVDDGNTAFLSIRELPYDLMFYLYFDECEDIPWNGLQGLEDSLVNLNLNASYLQSTAGFEFKYIQKFEARPIHWAYFGDRYICELEGGFEPLGTLQDSSVNFIRILYGGGQFLLHTQPRVFTNHFLLQKDGKGYTQGLLSYLNDGPIYWDEYSRVPERMARNQNNDYRSNPQERLQSQNPLQYILEQPPLAWAWYTLVGMGLLFMLFRTKRRQRAIPIIQSPRNSSLEFVQTIGWLYSQKSSHQELANLAIKNLRTHIKEQYGMAWRDNDPYFIQKLSKRSGVALDKIERLAKDMKNIPLYSGLVEAELIKFHQRLEHFYRASR